MLNAKENRGNMPPNAAECSQKGHLPKKSFEPEAGKPDPLLFACAMSPDECRKLWKGIGGAKTRILASVYQR